MNAYKRWGLRFVRTSVWLTMTIVGLIIICLIALSFGGVQRAVLDMIIGKAESRTGARISYDNVDLSILNSRLRLDGLYIGDNNADTILYIGSLETRYSLLGLLRNDITIGSLTVDNAVVNIYKQASDSQYNFMFIADAFSGGDKSSGSAARLSVNNIILNNCSVRYDIGLDKDSSGLFDVSHIGIDSLSLGGEVTVDENGVRVAVKGLSFKERSGFGVSALDTDITFGEKIHGSVRLLTPYSCVIMEDVEIESSPDFCRGNLKGKISTYDLRYFIAAKGEERLFDIRFDLFSAIPAVTLNNLRVESGRTLLSARAEIADYKSISKVNMVADTIRFSVKELGDLMSVFAPSFVLPASLQHLGNVNGNLKANGNPGNMKLDLYFSTQAGVVDYSARVSVDTLRRDLSAGGKIRLRNVNAALFAGTSSDLKKLNGYISFYISSVSRLSVRGDAVIETIGYKDYVFRDILLKGSYDPSEIHIAVKSSEPNIKLDGYANYYMAPEKESELYIHVEQFPLDMLYKRESWHDPRLSFLAQASVKGDNLSNITGSIRIDSLRLTDGGNLIFKPSAVTLISSGTEDGDRLLQLKSAMADINLKGIFNFAALPEEIKRIVASSLGVASGGVNLLKGGNVLELEATIKNLALLEPLLTLPFQTELPWSVNASMDAGHQYIGVNMDIPRMKVAANSFSDISVSGVLKDGGLNIRGSVGTKLSGKDLNASLVVSKSFDSDITGSLNVNNDLSEINGRISAMANICNGKDAIETSVKILPSWLNVGNTSFSLPPEASIRNYMGRTWIEGVELDVNGRRTLSVDGIVSEHPGDSISIRFRDTDAGNILSSLGIENIDARLNGSLVVNGLLDRPGFQTNDFVASDIMFYGDTLGSLSLKSSLEESAKGIIFESGLINGTSRSEISGFIPYSEGKMNLHLNLDRFRLGWLQRLSGGQISSISGSMNSELVIEGDRLSPSVKGKISFNGLSFVPAYNNVRYHISDTLDLYSGRLEFKGLKITDDDNNAIIAGGNIDASDLKNINYSLDAKISNISVLNIPDRVDGMFYGKVNISGGMGLAGTLNELNITGNITPGKKSEITVVSSDISEGNRYNSVVFVDRSSAGQPKEPATAEKSLDLMLSSHIAITPDMLIRYVLDRRLNNILWCRGSGDVKVGYEKGVMTAFGDFVAEEGKLTYNFQNFKTIVFNVKSGGKVLFSGDPQQAKMDIAAFSSVRAIPATLDASLSNERQRVDCIIKLSGDLNKIDFDFDIDLPDADDVTRSRIKGMVATQEQRVRQFVNLLVFGSFHNAGESYNVSSSALAFNMLSHSISGELESLFSSVLGERWQVEANLESNKANVGLSRKFFDDKLRFNTQFGYKSEQQYDASANTNTLSGEFELEYSITQRLKLKAYQNTDKNKSANQPDTKRGVGVEYSKRAKNFWGLFRFFKKNKNKK